uniref:Uncharacterized protein n=1 Tax=Triticum urartu TaxID=4572 RepID=A0A8R7P6Q4_TRIUA
MVSKQSIPSNSGANRGRNAGDFPLSGCCSAPAGGPPCFPSCPALAWPSSRSFLPCQENRAQPASGAMSAGDALRMEKASTLSILDRLETGMIPAAAPVADAFLHARCIEFASINRLPLLACL